jgi:hypothetical protein
MCFASAFLMHRLRGKQDLQRGKLSCPTLQRGDMNQGAICLSFRETPFIILYNVETITCGP